MGREPVPAMNSVESTLNSLSTRTCANAKAKVLVIFGEIRVASRPRSGLSMRTCLNASVACRVLSSDAYANPNSS
jgi:hypothetical protein